MGFCLYGNDINDETSPLEAGLGWITKFTKDFVNSAALLKQKEDGDWYLFHEVKQEKFIWDLAIDKKTKKIFVAPKNWELKVLLK